MPNGYLDIEELYKISCGKMGISPNDFWDMTPKEIDIICNGMYEQKKEDIELISYAVAVGYASAKRGKMLKIWKKSEDEKVQKVGKEKIKEEKEKLKNIFG